MKKAIFAVVVVSIMIFSTTACGTKVTTPSTYPEEALILSEYIWPDSDVAKLIPIPTSTLGKIEWEAQYGFVAYIGDTVIEEYSDYVTACKKMDSLKNIEKALIIFSGLTSMGIKSR